MTSGAPDERSDPGEEPTRTDPLSSDRLLRACARVPWENARCPVLGRVVLTAAIGKGGMGAVYRGIHRTLGKERAVKVLLASADDSARERFLREARFAAQIDSAHLVRVHDADEDPTSGLVYLEMEYVRGWSAAQWARGVAARTGVGVPEEDALVVCLAACRGLEAAHAAGVVHRDLKPGNILIPEGPDGSPMLAAAKVADLGLARREEGEATLTATNVFVGTPGFAAPEQIDDARNAGRPADVFAMGATLYALLSGRSPFDGSSSSDTIVRTTLGKRTPLADVRAGLSAATLALVDRCLSMDPADRYADATALREAIEGQILGAEPATIGRARTPPSRSEDATVGGAAPSSAPRPTQSPRPAPRPAAGVATPPVAAPPVPTPSAATPSAATPSPTSPAGRHLLPWIVTGFAVVALAVVAFRGFGGGTVGTPGAGGHGGAADTARVHLRDCPPGSRVFLGDREVREGDHIPPGPGSVRVTLDRHAEQTVPYGANDVGEIWIRPAEFRPNRAWIAVVTQFEGVEAFLGGKPVSGRLDVAPDLDLTFEFRRRGFGTQVVTSRVEPGGTATVTPPELWYWTGALSIELAAGAKVGYELTERTEVDGAADPGASGGRIDWEVERVGPNAAEPVLRLTVTRLRGRAVPPDGEPFDFDSADAGWAKLVAARGDAVAAAAPLALLEAGPIDVTFDADGAPRAWKPFAATVGGLPGVGHGKDEEVQRSVIAFLVLRPDLAGTTPLGDFSFHELTATTARLSAFARDRGAEVRSNLTIALPDGLGESLEVETKRGSEVTRVTVRRR